MSRFREQKTYLKALLGENDWKNALEAMITDPEAARKALNPLLSLLARPELRWQAACGLGLAVPILAVDDMESARVIMRRLMWSLNEESGNVGWGIPEAMACILAECPALAREYTHIFFSYGYDTGRDDNFIDHPPLRRGVFWGMGRLAQKNPEAALQALPHLTAALGDSDRPIRGLAAWAIARLAQGAAELTKRPGKESLHNARRALEMAMRHETKPGESIELFDGEAIITPRIQDLYLEAMQALPTTPI